MHDTVDDIMNILRECHPHKFNDYEERKISKTILEDSLEKISKDVDILLANTKCNMGSIEYANLNKMLAICNLKAGKEVKAIYHLTESHAVFLRQQILHRHMKNDMRERILKIPQNYGLKFEHVMFHAHDIEPHSTFMLNLTDLPKEWYMIQITSQFEIPNRSTCLRPFYNSMHSVHITILPTGNNVMKPFCITVPKPKICTNYDVCREVQEILESNKSDLEATYVNNELYWKMRERQNNKMKTAVTELERTWLREWRILFMADPIDNLDLVTYLSQMIDKLISDYKKCEDICFRTSWLLKKITLGACFLTREEIARAVKYVLHNHKKLADNVTLSIYGKLSCISLLENAKRMTLVMIMDEHMDYLPFESMEILKNHPVTRFPSIYIAYALYKQHESSIKDGCKIIKAKDDFGTFIVNPSGNLHKMEKRMALFIKYWLPHWKGLYNMEPEEEIFEDALTNYDILMYNGHGSGIQYLSGEHIEKLKVKAVVLLFGCNSIKLHPVGGRFPPYGISNQYLTAGSPCVLGALWEITDADIDKMTVNFISNWIPSSAVRPWSHVDINAWCSGNLKFTKSQSNKLTISPMECEMLRAVSKSKGACTQYMTAAAVIVRGLPIKLE